MDSLLAVLKAVPKVGQWVRQMAAQMVVLMVALMVAQMVVRMAVLLDQSTAVAEETGDYLPYDRNHSRQGSAHPQHPQLRGEKENQQESVSN
mgnify:FL=1